MFVASVTWRLGEEVLDKFDLGGGLTVPQQSMGSAIFQSGFDGLDGILGYVLILINKRTNLTLYRIGPVGLTSGTYTYYPYPICEYSVAESHYRHDAGWRPCAHSYRQPFLIRGHLCQSDWYLVQPNHHHRFTKRGVDLG